MNQKKKIKKRPKSQWQNRRSSSGFTSPGFTLIELLLGVGIMLLFGWQLHHYRHCAQRLLLNNTTGLLATSCLYARTMAHNTHSSYSLIINSDQGWYRIGNTTKRFLPAGVFFGSPPGALGPPSKATHIITKPITGGTQTADGAQLTWHPNGAAQPTTLYLHAGQHGSAISIMRGRLATMKIYWWDAKVMKWIM